ncbi:8-oxo-dGTP diphosphatase [Candidatus Parcubacteria bacterium]|nr:MAG: 8-oxo-dGTP diphosphatase [Candidatus Parcubacteria bacterium]
MNLSNYKKTLKNPLRARTITFLIKENRVVLGRKKQGFGKGNFLGIGGKVEIGEKIEDAAKREILEEIKVELTDVKHRGEIDFYFPHIADEKRNMKVHIFVCESWQGEPRETEEIAPFWFEKNSIPFEQMWDDAKYWLTEILEGKKLKAEFIYDKDLKVKDYKREYL